MNKFDKIFDSLHYIIEKQNIVQYPDEQIQKISFSNFLRDFIYAQMSARTVWKNIEINYKNIDSVFFYFDKDKIKECDGEYFNNELKKIGCGSQVRKKQMMMLTPNIQTLEKVDKEWGGIA